jgi:hypothetical protein
MRWVSGAEEEAGDEGVNEPTITINDVTLSEAQAATVRCAIEAFSADLRANGLGDDEHGHAMTIAYLRRIGELRHLIFGAFAVPTTPAQPASDT